MSFRDEVRAAALVAGPTCSVAVFRASLDEQDAAEFDEALDQDELASVHRAMVARKYPRSVEMVKRHKRGDCACARQ